MLRINWLQNIKKLVEKSDTLWDIKCIKGAAPLRALLVSVIRHLFFCLVFRHRQQGVYA